MSSYNHPGCSYCGGPFNGGNCPSCSSVGSENKFVYDPNTYSYNETPNFFNQSPHYSPSQYEMYSYEFCGNDAHYGYDCPPQVPFVYNQDPCFNQNFDNFPQTSPSFQQQYLCCENCGGPQCQPLNQNFYEPNHFYNSNSSGFDQFQPPQYPVSFQPSEEISIEELKTMMQSYCEIMSQRGEQEAILLQDEEKQELLAEEQAPNPFEPLPVSYFYNADYDNISTPSTTYTIHLTKSATIITNPFNLTRRIYHNHDIFYDGDDDEELFPDKIKRIQQILERTLFDAITPNFLITNSLSMGDEHISTILETKSDELIKSSVENLVPTPSESEDLSKDLSDIEKSDLIESLLNQDTLIISSPKFDSLLKEFSGELAHINLIPPGINEADFDPEEEIQLLSNDSSSLPINESFHFDVPSSPHPPAKPLDDDEIEPDTRVLTAKVVGDISKLYVHVPSILNTFPTLSPMFDTLLPFSSENDDKIFNHGILASNEEKSPHLLSHRGFNPSKIIFESPMMIYRGNIPTLEVLFLHFYPH
ncbi:hypothetical protein Tco_0915674 [Tanacetum coccineum]